MDRGCRDRQGEGRGAAEDVRQGGDSIENYQPEFWLEKSLEFCLEISYTRKKFKSWCLDINQGLNRISCCFSSQHSSQSFSIELGPRVMAAKERARAKRLELEEQLSFLGSEKENVRELEGNIADIERSAVRLHQARVTHT